LFPNSTRRRSGRTYPHRPPQPTTAAPSHLAVVTTRHARAPISSSCGCALPGGGKTWLPPTAASRVWAVLCAHEEHHICFAPNGDCNCFAVQRPVAFGSRKPVTAPLLPGSRSRALPTFQGPAGGLDGSPVLFGETPYRHDTRWYISSAVTRQDPAGLRAVCTRGAIRLWQDCKIRFRALQIGRVLSMYNAPRSKKEKYLPGGPVCTTRRAINQGLALPPVVVLGNATWESRTYARSIGRGRPG
jgi:hypothetical protein